MNTEIVKRYRCLPRRSRNLVNVALTYERLLADYSYSSERPFKRKSDRVCNFHVRFSLPLLPFLPFPDRRLGVTPVTRTRPHAFARNLARTSYALVSFLLVSSHLISSHLDSSCLVLFRTIRIRVCACCKESFFALPHVLLSLRGSERI